MPTAAFMPESANSGSPDASEYGLRHRLRMATQAAHRRLDLRLMGFDLTGIDGYRRFLEANAAVLLPLEAALSAADVWRIFPDWEMRSRRLAIMDDLAGIGGSARPLPMTDPLDFGGVLGTMYVLEGSRLGAKVILKTVGQSTDPRIAASTAYLRHGADKHLWRSFLGVLERRAPALGDEESAIAGALHAFGLFERAAAQAGDMPQHAAESIRA